jgi:hypothetical protein
MRLESPVWGATSLLPVTLLLVLLLLPGCGLIAFCGTSSDVRYGSDAREDYLVVGSVVALVTVALAVLQVRRSWSSRPAGRGYSGRT